MNIPALIPLLFACLLLGACTDEAAKPPPRAAQTQAGGVTLRIYSGQSFGQVFQLGHDLVTHCVGIGEIRLHLDGKTTLMYKADGVQHKIPVVVNADMELKASLQPYLEDGSLHLGDESILYEVTKKKSAPSAYRQGEVESYGDFSVILWELKPLEANARRADFSAFQQFIRLNKGKRMAVQFGVDEKTPAAEVFDYLCLANELPLNCIVSCSPPTTAEQVRLEYQLSALPDEVFGAFRAKASGNVDIHVTLNADQPKMSCKELFKKSDFYACNPKSITLRLGDRTAALYKNTAIHWCAPQPEDFMDEPPAAPQGIVTPGLPIDRAPFPKERYPYGQYLKGGSYEFIFWEVTPKNAANRKADLAQLEQLYRVHKSERLSVLFTVYEDLPLEDLFEYLYLVDELPLGCILDCPEDE